MIDHLVQCGVLSPRATYLCSLCIEDQYREQWPPSKKIRMESHPFELVLNAIKEKKLPEDQLKQLAYQIGQAQNKELFHDALEIGAQYRHVTARDMCASGRDAFKHTANPVVLQFLQGLCEKQPGQALDNHSVQETMEHVYYMRNERFVGPSAFAKTLMVYFSSRSKFAVNVLSKNGPYASYRTLMNWIEEQGSVPLAAPETDVITFFDNNQIIGKTHHISINNKCQTSTITTGIHISTEGPQIQHVKELSPEFWLQDFTATQAHMDQLSGMQKQAERLLRYGVSEV